jgi:hypothetical protein
MWVMISAPALVPFLPPLLAGGTVDVVAGESRGRLLPGCGVEVRAGTGPAGRAEEALRAADSDISLLNFWRLAARDMMAVDGGENEGW